MKKKSLQIKHPFRTSLPWILVTLGCILFSTWLMMHTFSYDEKNQSMLIASKLWSDFGAHIPLIRSFSLGGNWQRIISGVPPEYPIFPGEPIRYHFLFYLIVGFLERIGVRIDLALNIPSIIGFGGLMTAIVYVSFKLFGNWKISMLSLLFFVCNGSFGFLKFFEKNPLSDHTFYDIFANESFPAFGPWDGGLVTAFWNLNIYTNQRHLAIGFLVGLLTISLAYRMRTWSFRQQIPSIIGMIILFTFLPYLHQPMLLIIGIFYLWYFILFPRIRIPFILIGIITIPLIYWQLSPILKGGSETFSYYIGYLIHNEFTVSKFIRFWIYNLGLHSLLIPLGFLIATRRIKIFFAPLFILFIIGNMFKFSVEAAANHKFFNFALIFGNMLSAYFLISLYTIVQKRFRHWSMTFTLTVTICVLSFFLTLSGIIDFFVVANDHTLSLPDVKRNPVALWISKNTDPSAIILNSSYLYHPASIAGRSIFLGWPYFPWSSGYEENRMPIMKQMYEDANPATRCPILQKYHISYITVENVTGNPDLPTIRPHNFSLYTPVYTSPQGNYFIYTSKELCK